MKLYNDDCYNVIENLESGSVDMILTDPPYEIENQGGGLMNSTCRVFLKEINDMGMCKTEFDPKDFLPKTVRLFKSKEHYNAIYFCSRLQVADYLNFAIEEEFQYGIMFWHKTDPPPLCNNKYLNDIELIVYIKGKKSKIYGDYSTKSLVYTSGINRKDKDNWDHPTIKPLELINKFVINHTKENEVVFDPFMGSGTTGVSCKILNRDFIGVEKTEKYYRVAKKRIRTEQREDLDSIF